MCPLGFEVNGICTTIAGCIQMIKNPSKLCLACNSTSFYAIPVHGLCKCLQGNLINGLCSTIQGCSTPFLMPNNSTICLFCNVTANFNRLPDSNGLCSCRDKYELLNGVCSEKCGDGYLLNSSNNACDDGNNESGDGCSSTCTVEIGYHCENGSYLTPSLCFYVRHPINISLQSIRRTEGLNQGVFIFRISPSLPQFRFQDPYQNISLLCNSAYSVSDIAYSKGTITLIVDFTEDLEGRSCTLTLNISSSIRYPMSSLVFDAVSDDIPLVISLYLESYIAIKTIFRILGIVAIGLFIVSVSHKLIGAELLVCCQMVCLSSYFYRVAPFLFNSVKELGVVTGWPLLHSDSDSSTISPFSNRVDVGPSFAKNNVVALPILLFSIVLFVVLKLIRFLGRDSPTDQTKKGF
jgi:cysteine-rich repeat protein